MSGMETLLDALFLTSVLALLMTGSRRYLAMGLLTGLSVWVRPDGLTLLAPVILTILVIDMSNKDKFNSIVRYLIGFGSLFVPYLLFNLWLSGTPMPNTFYAKQVEYAYWQTEPFLYHIEVLLVQVFTGPGIILLPGIIGWAVLSIRRRDWASMASMLWCGGYLYLYISRLPAYQHGRYFNARHADSVFVWPAGVFRVCKIKSPETLSSDSATGLASKSGVGDTWLCCARRAGLRRRCGSHQNWRWW